MPNNMLVAGRDCGGCIECCHALSIDAPTLQKPNGIACPHICDSGCGNYEIRPAPCRDWYCAWRLSDTLDDEWRPDRSGFLVEILFDHVPTGFSLPAIRFTLLRVDTDIAWPPFVDLVTKAIAIRQPAYLCLAGPPGYLPASSLLNVPAFVAAVDDGDKDAIHQCLKRAGECLDTHHRERRSA